MSKQNGNKGRRFDRAFKEEAVRLLQTSGRRQRQIAGDLGISVSALGRWVAELRGYMIPISNTSLARSS